MKKPEIAEGFKNQYLFVLSDHHVNDDKYGVFLADFRVTDIGYFPFAQYHYFERQEALDSYILILCTDGKGSYRLGNRHRIAVSRGQAFIIPANTAHVYQADVSEPWSVYWFHFSGNHAESLFQAVMSNRDIFYIPEEQMDEIIHLFYSCFSILKRPSRVEDYFTIAQYASTILGQCIQATKYLRMLLSDKSSDSVEQVIQYMKENLTRTLTLREIALIAGYSPSHLSAIFKASTDYSPMDYHNRLRINAAAKALYFTAIQVKEVAIQYGYDDPGYFSRQFKKIMGMSPKSYKSLKKG